MQNYIAHLQLDDPEDYFTQNDPLSEEIANTGYLNDPNILNRTLIVRIFGAKNLKRLTR